MTEPTAFPVHPISVDDTIDEVEWESFWHNAVGGTLFNSLKFLAYHPPGRFNSHHIAFRRKGNLVGIFPGVIQNDSDGALLWASHPGASYGGPVYAPQLQYHQLEALVRSLVDYARSRGFQRLRLTPPPIIYSDPPGEALPFALLRSGFRAVRTELTQAVRLNVERGKLLDSFVNKTRTAFRHAARTGLTFRIIESPTDAELDEFWEILVENRRGLGVVPAHSRDEIARLHRLVPEHLMMAAVEHGGRMAAVIWNFICNRNTVLEFYMAHRADAQGLRPVPFLTYHTLLWAHERGFKWLDFGISSIRGEPTWGLLRFKENFNARHFLRQTYQIELN